MPDPKSLRQRIVPTAQSRTRAKELRRQLTPPEKKLWAAIKSKKLNNLHFRTQHPLGSFIADFYCHAPRLVVEIDGNQHQGDQLNHDKHRDQWMQAQGLTVLRFHARDVFNNLQSVLDTIAHTAQTCQAQRAKENPPTSN